MIAQTEIDFCASRHRGNPNSRSAFQTIAPKIGQAQKELLDWLKEAKEGSCEDYARHIGKGVNCVSGRFSELKTAGLIEAFATRKNESGNKVSVYRLKV